MLTLNSPAKVNLFLRIIKKRPDGYHELASLMQTISLCDTIKFSLSDRDHLTCTDLSLPTDGSNLILKAADLFRRKTGCEFGLKAHLDKRIPHQAGLGGGSSNAATTLWALNKLCKQNASDQQLAAWAGEIGSDISFFLSQGTAYCTGRGEVLRPLHPIPAKELWVVKPFQGLSTPEVYRNLDVAKLSARDPEILLKDIMNGQASYFNDLEEPAFRLMPSLAALKSSLTQAGFQAVMSGSGSAFFCFGKNAPQVPQAFTAKARFLNRPSDSWF